MIETWVTAVKAGMQQRVLAQRQGMEGPLLVLSLFAPECPAVCANTAPVGKFAALTSTDRGVSVS